MPETESQKTHNEFKKRMTKIMPPIRKAILVFDAVVASIKCVMTSQSFPMLNIL